MHEKVLMLKGSNKFLYLKYYKVKIRARVINGYPNIHCQLKLNFTCAHIWVSVRAHCMCICSSFCEGVGFLHVRDELLAYIEKEVPYMRPQTIREHSEV